MPPHFLLLVFYGPAGIMTDRIIKSLRRRALKNHLVQTLTHHHLDIRGSWCPNLALLLPVQLCKSVATGSTAPIAMGSMPLIIQGAISVLAWLCEHRCGGRMDNSGKAGQLIGWGKCTCWACSSVQGGVRLTTAILDQEDIFSLAGDKCYLLWRISFRYSVLIADTLCNPRNAP